ncbi:choice-of-anchor M domain-containing protein [Kineosporia sp. J2-2]|uniref:Choice-of-anchor M domain-containing protein n=1 Tax=Kineosporia corallincola TaxID=2835133 RepID=A0ABS5TTB4_9ACTN|nr:choice-of-anchor M domain-containing protein [Kineosporia corallincola]MBT0774025.1 choice-of-anchor M domain-containing protein [Kineosporia corallincola]
MLALAPAPAAPSPPSTSELRDGHADLGPVYQDGRWQIQLKDDTSGTTRWRDPAGVGLRISDAARHPLPDDSDYAFLGSPGDEVYLIPQTQVSGVLWLGWNTQHPSLDRRQISDVAFSLHDLTGPGNLHVYLDYSGFRAPQQLWDGTDVTQTIDVLPGVHTHANWAFSAPGDYHAVFTATLTPRDGDKVSASADLHFLVSDSATTTATSSRSSVPVGPVAAAAAVVVTAVVVPVVARRRRRGARR